MLFFLLERYDSNIHHFSSFTVWKQITPTIWILHQRGSSCVFPKSTLNEGCCFFPRIYYSLSLSVWYKLTVNLSSTCNGCCIFEWTEFEFSILAELLKFVFIHSHLWEAHCQNLTKAFQTCWLAWEYHQIANGFHFSLSS